jgi:hypothetical protein
VPYSVVERKGSRPPDWKNVLRIGKKFGDGFTIDADTLQNWYETPDRLTLKSIVS